jgi:hypothetical protein
MISLRPWTVRQALPFVARVHRRLPYVQGALWAVRVVDGEETVGCAVVGHPARSWMDMDVLGVLRVAVMPGIVNGCSMLYGACSRAARAMGATDLVTYTHEDEPGVSLRAAGWVDAGLTGGASGLEKPGKGRWRRTQVQSEGGSHHGAEWPKNSSSHSSDEVMSEAKSPEKSMG